MEKSITAGLEEYIRTIPGMKEIDAKQCSHWFLPMWETACMI